VEQIADDQAKLAKLCVVIVAEAKTSFNKKVFEKEGEKTGGLSKMRGGSHISKWGHGPSNTKPWPGERMGRLGARPNQRRW